jgi:DNA-binding beta-propeller fold protein YncE
MKYLFRLSILLFSLSSCGRPPIKPEKQVIHSSIPVAVVVESEIKGEIFGVPLKNPSGLSIDSAGSIYVCDQGNNRIIKFSPDLKPVKEVGGYGSQTGLFDQPRYITSDEFRYILVSDAGNHRIQKLDYNLAFVDVIILDDLDDPLKYGSLSGLAISSDGSIRVADPERNRLVSLNNVGQFEKFTGDLGDRGGQLFEPAKVTIDHHDNIFICDAGNGRVVEYDKYQTFSREIADPSMIKPVASVFPDEETLWILDQQANSLFCFSSAGLKLTTQPIPIYGGERQLSNPYDLLLLPGDRMLISDFGNDRMVVCKIIFNQTSNR